MLTGARVLDLSLELALVVQRRLELLGTGIGPGLASTAIVEVYLPRESDAYAVGAFQNSRCARRSPPACPRMGRKLH